MSMWTPQPFFQDAMVLLADYNRFSTSYLAHMLSGAGVRIIGPFTSQQELQEWLLAPTAIPVVAVVALDAAREMPALMKEFLATLGVPHLLVQSDARHIPLGGV